MLLLPALQTLAYLAQIISVSPVKLRLVSRPAVAILVLPAMTTKASHALAMLLFIIVKIR